MIIRDNSTGRINNPYLRTAPASEKTQREATGREPAAKERDEVGISAEAMMLQKSAAAAAEGEEVRWDKVNELRQRLTSGEYRVAPDKLAQRLLGTG